MEYIEEKEDEDGQEDKRIVRIMRSRMRRRMMMRVMRGRDERERE